MSELENKKIPKTIIVFRDGVGDGQIDQVNTVEVNSIRKCLDDMGLEETRLAVVIVSKRINTKFVSENSPGVFDNPSPGTVVDTVVTLPERYDFFLVPQVTTGGTISPTSFNVVHDSTNLYPDHMQRLAYKLTHLYYNWAGTIKVPAPCQYAHKLAYVTGTAVHEKPHPKIAGLLWYL